MFRILIPILMWLGAYVFPQAASAACLSYAPTDGKAITIAVATADVDGFKSRGYVEAVCPAGYDITTERVANLCATLRAYPEEAVARFTEVYRATPEEVCLTAESYLAETSSG